MSQSDGRSETSKAELPQQNGQQPELSGQVDHDSAGSGFDPPGAHIDPGQQGFGLRIDPFPDLLGRPGVGHRARRTPSRDQPFDLAAELESVHDSGSP
jgi:hypothetical protein